MKILFINQTLGNPGGAEVFNSDLLNELAKVEKNTLTVASNNTKFLNMLSVPDIHTHQIQYVVDVVGNWKGLIKAPFFAPVLFLSYWKILNQTKYDVVLMSGFIEKIIATPIAKYLNIPVVWIEFGPLAPLFKKFFGFPKLLYLRAVNLPKKIIVPSQNTLKNLKNELKVSQNKFELIPCGRNISKKYNKHNQKNQITCISRLEKGKGQDILMQAFAQIHKKYPKLQLVFVGTGDFKAELVQLAKKLRITQKVSFLHEVPSALDVLAESKIAVFPSVWNLEGFGLVLIEALYTQTPVIAFNHGPGNEIITHNQNGLLAKSGSASDLAKKIDKLLQSKKLQEKIITRGKKDYENKYEIANIAKKYQELLEIWR